MTSMTDQNRVQTLLQAIFSLTATTTYTPGAGGGSAFLVTPPFLLKLIITAGSNTANGTEAATAYGYTQGGLTLGSQFCAAPTAGVSTNSNAVSWTATGTWAAPITTIEIWDSAATKLRWLQGALTSNISGVINGDTVQFAAASISVNASLW